MKRRDAVENIDAEPLETLEPIVPFTVATESKATAQFADKTRSPNVRRYAAITMGAILTALVYVGVSDANRHNYNASKAEKARAEEASRQPEVPAIKLPRIPEGKFSPDFAGVVCGEIVEHTLVKSDVVSQIITEGFEGQQMTAEELRFAEEVHGRNVNYIASDLARIESEAKTGDTKIRFFGDCVKISPVFTTYGESDTGQPTYLRQATYQSYSNTDGVPLISITYRSNKAGEFIPEAVACQNHGVCEPYVFGESQREQ